MQGECLSVLPALTVDGIVAVDIFKGTVNREMFVKFLKEELVSPSFISLPAVFFLGR